MTFPQGKDGPLRLCTGQEYRTMLVASEFDGGQGQGDVPVALDPREAGGEDDVLSLGRVLLYDPPSDDFAREFVVHVLVKVGRVSVCILVEGPTGDQEAVGDGVRKVTSRLVEGLDDVPGDDGAVRRGDVFLLDLQREET